MKKKVIDLILIGVIGGSAGFIGLRLLGNSHRLSPSVSQPVAKNALLSDSSNDVTKTLEKTFDQDEARMYRFEWQNSLLKVRKVSKSDWDNLTKHPEVASLKVLKTRACAQPANPAIRGSVFVVRELVDRISTDELNILFEPFGQRCIRLDDRISILYASSNLLKPALTYAGTVKIDGMLEIPQNQWPARLFQLLDVAPAQFFSQPQAIARSAGLKTTTITMVRLADFQKDPAPDSAPMAHLAYLPLQSEEMKELIASHRPYTVLDVRSVQESQQRPVSRAINIPYTLAKEAGSSNRFSWNTTNEQLAKSEFKIVDFIADLQRKTTETVVIVGDGPQDGRPIWAMQEILRSGSTKVFWYVDGAESLQALVGR